MIYLSICELNFEVKKGDLPKRLNILYICKSPVSADIREIAQLSIRQNRNRNQI
jgi:hypothetical protein